MSTNKQIVAFVGLVVSVVVVWNVAIQISRRDLFAITIRVIPSDSVVTLDGDRVNNGVVYVSPGKHYLQAAREYFETDSTVVNVTSNSEDPVYLLPNPNTVEANEWLRQHPDEQQEREGIISQQVAQKQAEIANKYPIITKLPVYNDRYRIDYSLEGDQIFYSVTLYPIINGPGDRARYEKQVKEYKADALKFLINNGVVISDAEIEFTPDL